MEHVEGKTLIKTPDDTLDTDPQQPHPSRALATGKLIIYRSGYSVVVSAAHPSFYRHLKNDRRRGPGRASALTCRCKGVEAVSIAQGTLATTAGPCKAGSGALAA